MATQWVRKETIIWPPLAPIYTYGALFLAVLLTGLLLYCRFSFGMTPLQRYYTPIYVRSTLAGKIGAKAGPTTTGCSSSVAAKFGRVWPQVPML